MRKLPRLERRAAQRMKSGRQPWETAAKRLQRQPRAFDNLLRLHQALKTRPSLNLRAYRLICAHGLRGLGFDAALIAAELGVSMRHVRRLLRKDLVGPIAGAAHSWAQVEARRLVSDLRAELKAEGFRFHQWVMRGDRLAGPPTHPDRPTPAFKVKALMREEKIALLRAGLSADQVWAIGVAGLGADELNEFLMRGLR